LYDAINMASTSKIYPENFNDNNSFKVDTLSVLLGRGYIREADADGEALIYKCNSNLEP
jgi:hypothetical protein